MAHLQQTPVGPCWTGFGLTITGHDTDSDTTRATLHLNGDLDPASTRLLRACLEHGLASGRRYVRLDLSGLAFIDATGLDVIADQHWAHLAQRGTLVLTGVTPRVARLLKITGLDRVLLIATEHAAGTPAWLATASSH